MELWCRVCLKEVKGNLIPISFVVGETPIARMITDCSGIVPQENVPPNHCCERCVEGLYIAYHIVKQCRESDEKLRALNNTLLEKAGQENAVVNYEDYNDTGCSSDSAEYASEEQQASIIVPQKTTQAATCCACRAIFNSQQSLTDHIKLVHEPERTQNDSKKPYQCEVCFKRYFKKTSLNRHKRMGSLGANIKITKDVQEPTLTIHRCCGCRQEFETAEELETHSSSKHLAARTVDESKQFECEICFKRYSSKTSLNRHFRERFTEKRIRTVRKLEDNQCCGCRLKFDTKEQLSQHSSKIHEPDRTEDVGKMKPFECDICFCRYSAQEALTRHKTYIGIDQLYKCQQCSKSFVKRIMLRAHERKFHDGVQNSVIGPYQCTRCGKTFMQPSSLTNHEKIHDRAEQFECSVCDKTFLSKGNLQTHLKLHSNPRERREAQYECPICRCRFKTPNYLEIHARVHTGEKPYKCKFCLKQFAHASGHNRHMLIHTGVKPFVCRHCGREFSNRPNMLIHEKGHGEERSAKCDICEKEFVHIRYLKKHRRRHFK